MIERVRRAVPFLIAVGATLAAVGFEPILIGLGVGGIVSVFLPWRVPSSRLGELVTFALAIAIGRGVAQTEPWDDVLGSFFILAVLGSVLVRLFLVRPMLGRRLDVGLMLALFVPLSYLLSRRMCAAFTVPFVVSAFLTRDRHEPPSALGRSPGGTLLVLGATVGIAALGTAGIPALDRLTNRRIATMIGMRSARVGFTGRLALGESTQILRSEDLVMRIHPGRSGSRPDYLRGRAFDAFDGVRWFTSRDRHFERRKASSRAPDPAAVRVEAVANAPALFAPDLHTVDTRAGAVLDIDAFGVVRAAVREQTNAWSLTPDEAAVPANPGPADLQIPAKIEARIKALAAEWTASATTDRERLETIERRLRAYRYTLDRSQRTTPPDPSPILDFLFVHQEGHCEYIATAMALLARAVGIPARVVTGYRVVEENTLGGYWVVREKHAHAWVEAWSGGAFHTVDATPSTMNLAEHATPTASATYDWARTLIARALREFADSPDKALVAFSVLLGLFVGGRGLRGWLQGRRARAQRGRGLRPPSFFLVLDAALAHAKVPRGRAETLEDWADRLERAGDLGDAASAIRSYARHRYGSAPEGDLPRVCAAVADRLASVHGRPSLVPR